MKPGFIAVFDSGVGGISVLAELVSHMPEEDYVYFGDSKNAPYGERSVEEVRELTLKNIKMLVSAGAKAVVIACNTATSAAISILREEYDIPVIGIEPAVKPAIMYKNNSVVLCMATAVTLHEEKFCELVSHFSGKARVIPLPCHDLAGLIEKGEIHSEKTVNYLKNILSPFVGKVDSVVLGCTHYPFVKDEIAKIMGDGVRIFDGGLGTAKETKRRLVEAGIKKEQGTCGNIEILNSLKTPDMVNLSKKLLESIKKC